MPAKNGLVDLGSDPPRVIPHTSRFFSTYVLPYAFDPDAPPPEVWFKFLRAQWADDPQSIESFHEMMGYLLTLDTRFQKMFLLIGPPGSGRRTMKEIVTRLVRVRNVASTSASALNNPFGLEPLEGKSVADARVGRDSSVMMDRLLRIVGGDPVEIHRKNKPILPNVKMTTRFLLIANELPQFRDASNAITRRYHILRTPNTIPAEERDANLVSKLERELPGILNLAIQGRKRLNIRGRFRQAESAADLLETARDLASPTRECVSECFTLRESATVSKADAFKIWKDWALAHGEHVGSSATFGKSLLAAFPGVKTTRLRIEGQQITAYLGIEARRAWTRKDEHGGAGER